MNKTLYIDNFVFWHENDTENIPDVSFVAPMLRRRMSVLEKIAVFLAHKIAPENPEYSTVFASQFGEWEQTIKLIKQFYNDGEMSPAGFSNSVHNAAMGHLSLLNHNKKSYTSVAGGKKTIQNALIDAIGTNGTTLFIFAEERTPIEYEKIVETPVLSHGCALLISDTGKNKYELIPNNQDLPALSFNELKHCLENKTDIKTSNWILVKK